MLLSKHVANIHNINGFCNSFARKSVKKKEKWKYFLDVIGKKT